MIPANLSIITGGILAESRLSLRHVRRVLDATHINCGLHDTMLVICYVTSQQYIEVAAKEWKKHLEMSRVFFGLTHTCSVMLVLILSEVENLICSTRVSYDANCYSC